MLRGVGHCSVLSPTHSGSHDLCRLCPLCLNVWEGAGAPSFQTHTFPQLMVLIWLWPQLEKSSSQQGWGCLLATNCDPPALLSMTLCRRCSYSSPGPSLLHPILPPITLKGNWAGCNISRPLPVRQIGLELAGGLRSY